MFRIQNRILLYILIAASLLLALLYSPVGSPYYYADNSLVPQGSVNFSKGIPNLPKNSTYSLSNGSEMNLPQISETGNVTTPQRKYTPTRASQSSSSTPTSGVQGSVYLSTLSSSVSQGGAGGSMGGSGTLSSGGGARNNGSSVSANPGSNSFGSFNLAINKREKKENNPPNTNDLLPINLVDNPISSFDDNGLQKGPGFPPPNPDPTIPVSDGLPFLLLLLSVYAGAIVYRRVKLN